jgi:hypothetical protein
MRDAFVQLNPPALGRPDPICRERRWQLRQKAAGNCVTCGKPRKFSARFCPKHEAESTAKRGYQPWRPGGRGRAPVGLR